MNIKISNVGVIKEADIKLDGITVIVGENTSGKTTISKALYSLVSPLVDSKNAFIQDAIRYTEMELEEIFGSWQRVLDVKKTDSREQSPINNLLKAIVGDYTFKNIMDIIVFIDNINREIENINYNDIIRELNIFFGDRNFLLKSGPFAINSSKLTEIKKGLKELQNNLRQVSVEDYLINKTVISFDMEFYDQVKTALNTDDLPVVELYDDNEPDSPAYSYRTNGSKAVKTSSGKCIFPSCIFIDNVEVIDDLCQHKNTSQKPVIFRKQNGRSFFLITVNRHKDNLFELLNNAIQDRQYIRGTGTDTTKMLDFIIPEKILIDKNGEYKTDSKIDIRNMASGSKFYSILKILHDSGNLKENTLLILDEPENHLHPKWINELGEILVKLVIEYKIRILLTTHSPNLLLAIDTCSQENNINDKKHFYTSQKDTQSNTYSFIDVNGKVTDLYEDLCCPFVEMGNRREKLKHKGKADEQKRC